MATLLLLVALAQASDDSAPTLSLAAPASAMKEIDACIEKNDRTGLVAAIERAQRNFGARTVAVGGTQRSFSRALREVVAKLPEDAQALVRAADESRAKDLLARWRVDGDPGRLREIVDSCALAPQVPFALHALAEDASDRGDMSAASACWWRLLHEHPASDVPRAVTAVRLAHAWIRAGRRDEIARLVADAKTLGLDGDVMVGDARLPAVGYLESLAAASLVCRDPAVPARAPDPRHLPTEPLAQMVLGPRANVEMVLGGSTPAVTGDLLILPLVDRVVAVRLGDAQEIAWSRIDGPGLAAGAYLPLAAAVRGDVVVATRYGAEPGPCVVRAYSRATGVVLWAQQEATFLKGGWPQSTVQLSAPVIVGDLVCFAVNESTNLIDIASAVALDLKTGAVRWSREIARAPGTGAFAWRTLQGKPVVTGVPPAASAADGRLFVATNLGVVAALDAADGDLAWARTYPRTMACSDKPPTRRDLARMKDLGFPHAHAGPVFAHGRVFHLPLDGDTVLAFERAGGEPAAMPDLSAIQPSHIAAFEGRLVAAGPGGAIVVDVAANAGERIDAVSGPVSRLAVADGQLHVVTDTRVPQLVRYDLRAKALMEVTPMLGVGDDAGLVAAAGRLLTAGATLDVYEPSAVHRKALAAVMTGAPLTEEQSATYVAGLVEAGDLRRAAELSPAMMSAPARRDPVLDRALERMHEARSPDERAAWARRAVARAQSKEQQTEALAVLADALRARDRNEEALDAAAIALAETSGGPGPADLFRSDARHTAWRVIEGDNAARQAYELRADAARRSVKDGDADALLRHARAFPYSKSGLDALEKSVRLIGAADARPDRVLSALLEVGPTLAKDARAKLADALESRLPHFPDDGEDYKRGAKLVELFRR